MCELRPSVQESKSTGREVEKWCQDALVSALVEPTAVTQGQSCPNKLTAGIG